MSFAHEFGHLMGARHDWADRRVDDLAEKAVPASATASSIFPESRRTGRRFGP